MKTFNETIIKNYNLLVDTLLMASPDITRLDDDKLNNYLEELEGDYYTFLDMGTTELLVNEKIINISQQEAIFQIKLEINKIKPEFWNIESFKTDVQWINVSLASKEVLKSMGIQKTKIDNNIIIPILKF